MPSWPCCDCYLPGDCDAGNEHAQPCDIHQVPDASRENPGWATRREE